MTMPKFEPVGLPDLPAAVSKGNLGTYLFDTMQMHQYAMRYLDLHAEQLTEAYEAGKREQAAELAAARAEIELLLDAVREVRSWNVGSSDDLKWLDGLLEDLK